MFFIKKFGALICYIITIIYVLYNSKLVFSGVKEGIDIVIYTLIPSLFIFMIISGLICCSSALSVIGKPFGFIAKKLFRIDASLFTIVILSLIGGYPACAKILDEFVASKKITQDTAKKMINYCVNCGPAFLITGIGTALFDNVYIGIFMYISQILACIIIGVVCSFLHKSDNTTPAALSVTTDSFSTSLVKSVNTSVKAMATLGGLVVLFCGISYPILDFITQKFGDFSSIVKGFLEVTSGVVAINSSSSSHKIELICAATAFGGICVHLQILALTTNIKFSYKRFFIMRVIYTAISVEFIKLFLNLFPQTLSCATVNSSMFASVSSKSPYALILLCFLCFIYLCTFVGIKKER